MPAAQGGERAHRVGVAAGATGLFDAGELSLQAALGRAGDMAHLRLGLDDRAELDDRAGAPLLRLQLARFYSAPNFASFFNIIWQAIR
jgi:hypothetical protein